MTSSHGNHAHGIQHIPLCAKLSSDSGELLKLKEVASVNCYSGLPPYRYVTHGNAHNGNKKAKSERYVPVPVYSLFF